MDDSAAPAQTTVASALDRAQAVAKLAAIERARANVNDFIEYTFQITPGKFVHQGKIHRRWHAHVDKHPFAGVIAPRDHGKSMQMVIFRALWELGKNPMLRIKIVANDLLKGKKRIRAIRSEIDNNPRLREVFPTLASDSNNEDWTAATITVQRPISGVEPSIEARGVLTAATGGRADLLIFDDVCDLKNSVNHPKERERVKTMVKEDWLNLLEPTGRAIYIATPWHHCLAEGQLVTTTRGRVRVEHLRPDDVLRVAPGVWEPYQAIERKYVSGDVIDIRLWCQGQTYRVTPEHRFPTQRGDVAACDLTEADQILLHVGCGEMDVAELSELEPAPPPRVARPLERRFKKKTKVSREQLAAALAEGLTYAEAAERFAYRGGKQMISYLVRLFGLTPNTNEFSPRPGWIVSPLFWRFAGYWLAEGCYTRSNGSIRLRFGFSEEERGFANDAAQCARDALGVPVAVRLKERSTLVQFNCRLIGEWLLQHFGNGARRKRLPHWLERVPHNLAVELVRGHWLGDGSATSVGVRFATSSRDLAYDLTRLLAQRFSVLARVIHTPAKAVVISGNAAIGGKSYEVRIRRVDGHDIGIPVAGATQIHGHTRLQRHPGAVGYPIRRIRRMPYSGWVYDLQTSTGYFDLCGVTSHNSDLTHELMVSPDWKFIKDVINDSFDPIWPEHWSREALKKRYSMIGHIAFARGYGCKTISDAADTLFNEADLERAKDHDLSPQEADKLTETWVRYIGVDPASGKRTRSAKYQVIFTLAVNPTTGERIPLDISRKREPMPRFIKRIAATAEKFHAAAIIVENNAVQQGIIDMAREHELAGLPVKAAHTGKEKMDPQIGVPALAAEFESGLWRLPFGGEGKGLGAGPTKRMHADTCRCNFCLFVCECRDGVLAEYTDILMAAWISTRLIRRRTGANMEALGVGGTRRREITAPWDIGTGPADDMNFGRKPAHYDHGW